MKYLLFIFCLVAFQPLYGQRKAQLLDSMMQLFESRTQFNGVVLVAEGGQVTYKKAFGYANEEWKVPNTTDTKFKLASLGKQFTALLILQLVEAGKIKLDGTISDYLPDYPKKTGQKVTIHHLLTHSSGIPNYHSIPDFDAKIGPVNTKAEDFIALFSSKDLLFEPGSQYAYSNLGYYLLGYIAEKVSGKSYSELMHEKIFGPAGMKDSFTEDEPRVMEHAASGYQDNYVNLQPARFRHPSSCGGAGVALSTVEDFFRYDRALRNNTLLSPEYSKLFFTPYIEGYSYGWNIMSYPLPKNDSVTVAYHDGGTAGFCSLAYRFLENDKLIVVFSNHFPYDLYAITRCLGRVINDKELIYPKTDLVGLFARTLESKGIEAARDELVRLRKDENSYTFDGSAFNILGYNYMNKKRYTEALEVFRLNVSFFPNTADVYDSLGEVYLKTGEWEKATLNYNKSLELDPGNSNARVMLEEIKKRKG